MKPGSRGTRICLKIKKRLEKNTIYNHHSDYSAHFFYDWVQSDSLELAG